MEVTKKEAAKILDISPAEVLRQVGTGELKGRQKTASKYSDWIITLPSKSEERRESAVLEEQVAAEFDEKGQPEPIANDEPDEEPIAEHKTIKLCERCKTAPLDPNVDSNICGTCADELRAEADAGRELEDEIAEEQRIAKEKAKQEAEEKTRKEDKNDKPKGREDEQGKKAPKWWF